VQLASSAIRTRTDSQQTFERRDAFVPLAKPVRRLPNYAILSESALAVSDAADTAPYRARALAGVLGEFEVALNLARSGGDHQSETTVDL
jgi:hypothetical protein